MTRKRKGVSGESNIAKCGRGRWSNLEERDAPIADVTSFLSWKSTTSTAVVGGLQNQGLIASFIEILLVAE